MSDIQRYAMRGATRHNGGDFVTYADHIEALRQAEQETLRFGSYKYEQGQRDALAGAVQSISAEAAAAIDLYVLEQGPLRFDKDGGTYRVKQDVRLRLKSADELRADGWHAACEAAEDKLDGMTRQAGRDWIDCGDAKRVIAGLRASGPTHIRTDIGTDMSTDPHDDPCDCEQCIRRYWND